MPEKEGYEVIKFVEKKSVCYTSTDYAEGVTLYHWVKYHKKIKKEKLYTWFQDLLTQLVMFHKQKGSPYYNYLSPYHIIVTRQNRLLLMDTETMDTHMEYPLDKYFTPLTIEQNGDVYCFGKIIQFIMAHIQCEPCLTRREEHQLLKIVKKCLETRPKHHYKNIQTIQNDFIKKKWDWIHFQQFSTKINEKILGAVAVIAVLIVGYQLLKSADFPVEQPEIEMQTEIQDTESTEADRYMDMGLMYFLQLDDYGKSIEYFKQAEGENEKAKYYTELAKYMSDTSEEQVGKCPEISLERLKKQILREEKPDAKELIILMKCYVLVDTEDAYQSMIEIGDLAGKSDAGETFSDELQKEICHYRALAYEKLEMWEEALASYQRLLESENEQNDMEQLYLKIIDIYKRENQWDNVRLFAEQGMKEAETFSALLAKQGVQEGENLWTEGKK